MSTNGTSVQMGLREQKKALTRATIEATALERFLADGYEAVRLEDLCAQCLVSTRTFFRYFTSKEDLVLGRLRSHLVLAEHLLAGRPATEPVLMSLRAVVAEVAADYSADPERELTRLRLAGITPALGAGLGLVFGGFEELVRAFATSRWHADDDVRGPRLLAAAAVAAFKVGLDIWVQDDGGSDLGGIVMANLDDLSRDW
jgi:TetR/AcrR family transcriptional regulator, regulator of mycofactocin system